MTSWMKERDRLVEQTMAFVQGVAAQRPIKVESADQETLEPTTTPRVEKSMEATPVATNPTNEASLVEAEALMSLIAMSLPSLRPQPTGRLEPMTSVPEPTAAAPSPTPVGATVAPAPIYTPVPKRPNQLALPEREMIAQRVTNFRAGQMRLIREREDHYAMVQAKIRASLGNDPVA